MSLFDIWLEDLKKPVAPKEPSVSENIARRENPSGVQPDKVRNELRPLPKADPPPPKSPAPPKLPAPRVLEKSKPATRSRPDLLDTASAMFEDGARLEAQALVRDLNERRKAWRDGFEKLVVVVRKHMGGDLDAEIMKIRKGME